MTKKTNLADALQKESIVKNETAQKQDIENIQTSYVQASRIGKKSIIAYFDPDVIKQLKLIGIENDMTIQDMMQEALNDFFAKHAKAQIA